MKPSLSGGGSIIYDIFMQLML